MEKNVLPSPDVVRELTPYVPLELYVDRPTVESRKAQKWMEDLTGSVAMPIYAIVSPDGKLIRQVQGRRNPNDFIAFLRGDVPGRVAAR